MAKYKAEKTERIIRRLEALQHLGDETLTKVALVMKEKVEFYDRCLAGWDNPKLVYGQEQIETSRKCCHAGLDMADAIVNELRILFLKEGEL